ncbi:hypothetical protein [Amycolatopsis alba]|uniref:Uncharacterized protein n=1 Tax=Amycolatopsis alba DSM 44262 TaxID=1125972 RepID=A0A229R9I4_AMYAL|nr:hypothetical protein [Amycolatopsis alba]OXM43139.1 hypothetical protein CFP75_39760 [Amycolatopsis alba DSM 44262]
MTVVDTLIVAVIVLLAVCVVAVVIVAGILVWYIADAERRSQRTFTRIHDQAPIPQQRPLGTDPHQARRPSNPL